MSFVLRTARPAVASLLVPRTLRPFTSSRNLGLKESDMHDPNQASKYDTHKEDQLAKQKEGKGHWKPELASDSEEAVKADKHEHADHSEQGLKELQEKTKGSAEVNRKAGTSQGENV